MSDPSVDDSTEKRVAFVTGAASGIGRAGAVAFAAAGIKVMVVDRDRAGGISTVAMITAAGGEAEAIKCDVTDEDQVAAAVAATVETFGRLDIAFNNAGNAFGQAALHETELDDWRRSVDVNLTSVFLCMKHELRHMLDSGGGAIVNTSSGAARVPAPGRAAYSASKRGVVALTAHAARDYVNNGIRVNAVLPGVIDTPAVRANNDDARLSSMAAFLPGRRLGEPAEVADVALWLCSEEARYVNGQAIVVDGGMIHA